MPGSAWLDELVRARSTGSARVLRQRTAERFDAATRVSRCRRHGAMATSSRYLRRDRVRTFQEPFDASCIVLRILGEGGLPDRDERQIAGGGPCSHSIAVLVCERPRSDRRRPPGRGLRTAARESAARARPRRSRPRAPRRCRRRDCRRRGVRPARSGRGAAAPRGREARRRGRPRDSRPGCCITSLIAACARSAPTMSANSVSGMRRRSQQPGARLVGQVVAGLLGIRRVADDIHVAQRGEVACERSRHRVRDARAPPDAGSRKTHRRPAAAPSCARMPVARSSDRGARRATPRVQLVVPRLAEASSGSPHGGSILIAVRALGDQPRDGDRARARSARC